MRITSCPKCSSGWISLCVIVVALLVALQPSLAGPPAKDLPDVKMPPIAKDHPRLVFRPAGKGAWTFDWQPGEFGFAAADLTCAYNSTYFSWPGQEPKIRRAVRGLVYLPEPETVLVYDRIVSTAAGYQKKWLLHTIDKPLVAQAKVLKGEADNGILEALGKDVRVTNKKGLMDVSALLPAQSRWLLVGGTDYRFYVETDGDQANGFDGQNVTKGLNTRGYFDAGNWRLELEPTIPAQADDFLVAMTLGTTDAPPAHKAVLVGRGERYAACQVGSTIVVFADAVGGTAGADAQVTPVAPANRVVTCVLTEPQDVPVGAFEPVRPPQRSTVCKLDTPLPAGKPAWVLWATDGPAKVVPEPAWSGPTSAR